MVAKDPPNPVNGAAVVVERPPNPVEVAVLEVPVSPREKDVVVAAAVEAAPAKAPKVDPAAPETVGGAPKVREGAEVVDVVAVAAPKVREGAEVKPGSVVVAAAPRVGAVVEAPKEKGATAAVVLGGAAKLTVGATAEVGLARENPATVEVEAAAPRPKDVAGAAGVVEAKLRVSPEVVLAGPAKLNEVAVVTAVGCAAPPTGVMVVLPKENPVVGAAAGADVGGAPPKEKAGVADVVEGAPKRLIVDALNALSELPLSTTTTVDDRSAFVVLLVAPGAK